MEHHHAGAIANNIAKVAASFVNARRRGEVLTVYPGEKPSSLDDAYRIQNKAIELWNTAVGGWKVGRIGGSAAQELGSDRLAGPVFQNFLWQDTGQVLDTGAFEHGFIAIEGEVVIMLGEDAPADKFDWTTDEAWRLIESMRAGAEIASSPYAAINDDGPLVTISDFGNNYGLIVGDEIPHWRQSRLEDWTCRTFIDDVLAGENTPAGIPGGPVESLRFLLENTARRGLPLKRGMAVCTGAITGVHEIRVGQQARVEFNGTGAIECRIVDAKTMLERYEPENTAAE